MQQYGEHPTSPRGRHPYGGAAGQPGPHNLAPPLGPNQPVDEVATDEFARIASTPRPPITAARWRLPHEVRDRLTKPALVLGFLACTTAGIGLANARPAPPAHQGAAAASPAPRLAEARPRILPPTAKHSPAAVAPSPARTPKPKPRAAEPPAARPLAKPVILAEPQTRRTTLESAPHREAHTPRPRPTEHSRRKPPTSRGLPPGPAWLHDPDPCSGFQPFQQPTCHAFLGQ